MGKLVVGLTRSLLLCAVALVLPALVAAQSTPIQPVFRFPLEQGYPQWGQCVQGTEADGGTFSHNLNETRYDFDFDTPNPGQQNELLRVVAAADGIAYTYDNGCVRNSTCSSAYGNYVKIAHGPNVFSLYAHLESISITNGRRVRAGDVIGIEGTTGRSQGDHLHFGVHNGNPQLAAIGISTPMKYMAVINTTTDSGVQFLRGGSRGVPSDFTCGLPVGHYYTAGEVPVCHTRTSQQPVPEGYGASYDVFSAQRELLLRATCALDDTHITIGYNNEQTYIYHLGYQWLNNKWEEIGLQCIGEKPGDIWCVGEAIGVISSQAEHFVAYTCRFTGGSWKCGCRDQQCAQSFWQLQTVE